MVVMQTLFLLQMVMLQVVVAVLLPLVKMEIQLAIPQEMAALEYLVQ
jgi:hypothetical protein